MSPVRHGAQRASSSPIGATDVADPQQFRADAVPTTANALPLIPPSPPTGQPDAGATHRRPPSWRPLGYIAIVTAVVLFSGLVGSSLSTAAPDPTITLESQAWWRRDGISVPDHVGAHVHTKATVPADGQIVNGRIDIPVTVTLHDARGKTNWFRIATESKSIYQRDLSLGPCNDCTASFTASVDLSGLPTGRHELRLSANNPDEDPDRAGAQRMYQSTGWQVCVRSCSPSYRGANHIEARGYYTDFGYQNTRLASDPADIRSGATIKVRFGPGSGGQATEFAGVYIDPNFHAGSAGTVVRQWSGAFSGSVTLPSVAAGPHRLVLVSSDGQSAGVLVIPFTQGSSDPPASTPKPTARPTPTPTTSTPTPGPPPTPDPASTPDTTGKSSSPTPAPDPTPAPRTQTSLIPDTSRKIDWRGGWATARHPSYRGGSVRWTKSRGDRATLVFSGTRVSWIGPTGPTRGKAKVYIDGKLVATVDLYSARFKSSRVVFSKAVPDGRHRITIKALGTAGRPIVAIDAIRIVDAN